MFSTAQIKTYDQKPPECFHNVLYYYLKNSKLNLGE